MNDRVVIAYGPPVANFVVAYAIAMSMMLRGLPIWLAVPFASAATFYAGYRAREDTP